MASRKNIAITDFEFTGLDPIRHEIIEIGVIVVGADSLEEITRFETKVKPEHIETGVPESLAVAGYKEEDWKSALPLHDAITQYLAITENSIFAAWCTPYDWIFLLEAFKKTGIKNPFGHRALDVFPIAYEKFKNNKTAQGLGLSSLAEYLRIPKEPMPHRAINGAECTLAIYRKLREIS